MYDASWWGYLGWGQSGNNLPAPEAPTPNIPASPASPSSDTPTIRAVKSDPQLSVSVEVPEPHANTRPKGQELKDGLSVPTSVQGVLDAKNKAQSVFSAGTSQTQGSTTWYEFARAILGGDEGQARVKAIPSAEYPTPARRPRNSVLDNGKLRRAFGIELPDWRTGLKLCLEEQG